MEQIAEATERLRDCIVDPAEGASMRDAIRLAHRGLVELGVVPEPIRILIADIEALGGGGQGLGGGKLCGARRGLPAGL